MSNISVALNRFGLGGRGGSAPPDAGRRGAQRRLLGQFDRFDPAPAEIATRPGGAEGVESLIFYRAERRRIVRAARAEGVTGITDEVRAALRNYRQKARQTYTDDVAARAMTAIASDTPFVERLVHFWSNHFAVSALKPQATEFCGSHEFEAIRPNVLGNFRDLLRDAVLHPGMLIYLDQLQSVGPNSVAGMRRNSRRRTDQNQLGLNENLAREILELHTVSVDAGYSQADVTEFARALTGYTFGGLPQIRRSVPVANGSAFAAAVHEPGARTVMGKRYEAANQQQALAILDDLTRHPATARHIATKLARHFCADDPPRSLVKRLETTFLQSGGDLPSVYRALVEAPEPWTANGAKFRTPWEWSIAAFRALGRPALSARQFVVLQNQLGQQVWAPPSPQGYPDTAAHWAAPDALIRRIEAADRLSARARITNVDDLARNLFPAAVNPTTLTAIARAESPAQAVALLLASPEMMRR